MDESDLAEESLKTVSQVDGTTGNANTDKSNQRPPKGKKQKKVKRNVVSPLPIPDDLEISPVDANMENNINATDKVHNLLIYDRCIFVTNLGNYYALII